MNTRPRRNPSATFKAKVALAASTTSYMAKTFGLPAILSTDQIRRSFSGIRKTFFVGEINLRINDAANFGGKFRFPQFPAPRGKESWNGRV